MRTTGHSALVVTALALACGASPAPPAAAQEKRPQRPSARALTIGAGTAHRVKRRWEVAAGGYARAVAIDRRLARVAFASRDGVSVHDLNSGKRLGGGRWCKETVHTGLGFVGDQLVVVCAEGLVSLDARTLKRRASPKLPSAAITAAAFSGKRLALGQRDGVVRIVDFSGGAMREVPVPGPPIDVKSLALSRNGERLAVAWVQGSVWWWDTKTPRESHRVVRHDRESDALAFNKDATLLAEEGARHQTTLWHLREQPKLSAKVKNGDWVKQIRFTRDDRWLVRGGSDGLELAEVGGAKRVVLDARGNVEDVALGERGEFLVAADRDGRLSLWAVR